MPLFLNGKVEVLSGDITVIRADAIVNAANSSLLGGGGVDGAIHRRGGPGILGECREIRQTKYPDGLPAGKAIATSAGKLPARYVIHTVGPIYQGGGENEDSLLDSAYRNSLLAADELSCKSIAFPAVSTGIYGFPKDLAAGIVSKVLRDYFQGGGKIGKIFLVFYSPGDMDIFLKNQILE